MGLKLTSFVALLFTFSCCLAPGAWAQAIAVAEVAGLVTDSSGQLVAGAKVKITDTGRDQSHTTSTNAQGRYVFPNLPTGSYSLEVTADGFKTYVQTGIILQVATNIELNAVLQVGQVSQRIEVTAGAAMVETKENSIAQVIDQQQMVDLPLNGRNPTQLILLTGASTTTPVGDLTGTKNIQGSNGSVSYSVAGGAANGLSYLLDGGDNNDAFSNVNLPLPFPDALQEFSVQTNGLPAQYGLHPGGVVNTVTKSGTNQLHGDVFEFLRNGDMNARQEGTPARDSLKRSQFGGVLGGKIITNKLFFFGGYEGTRQRSDPPNSVSYVPTPAELAGNFSINEKPQSQGGCSTGSSTKQLKSPSGTPYPNNQIPVSSLDPAALKLAENYLPAVSNNCGSVQYGIPANNPDDQWIGRVDYYHSQKHSLFARYYLYDYSAQAIFNGSNLLTTTSPGNKDRSQTITIGDTYVFSATRLNAFHASFVRRRDDRGSPPNLISPTDLGVNIAELLPNYIYLAVTNYFSAGCGTCAQGHFNVNTFQVSDDYTWITGRHQFGFGIDARREQLNIANNTLVNGDFQFNGSVTGDALADFLTGRISTLEQGNPNPDAIRETVFAAYAQDSFRIASRLTINYGIRWEPYLPAYDNYGRGNQFSLAAFNAGEHSSVYPNAPAGLLFAGDSQNPYGKAFTGSRWLLTSPRVGLVWDPRGDGKETIRASFALMHDTAELYFPERWTTNPPYASQVTLTPPPGPFSNPWQGYPGGSPFPGAAIFPLAGAYVNIPPGMEPTYMSQWNVSFQKQIASDWLLKVNYLGNESTHIWGARDINYSLYIPGSSAATNQRRLLYLANPSQGQYYSSIVQADDGGTGSYEALLVSLQHRFARHFTVLANYTWSHCLSETDFLEELSGPLYQNPNNRDAEHSSCVFDHRQIFNLSGVFTSPAVGNGVVRRIVEGWKLSPLLSANTGVALNVVDGKDVSLSGQNEDRPNLLLPDPYEPNRTPHLYLNPAAFALQPTGTFGDLGREAVYGPGSINLDLALSRSFQLSERIRLDFRLEAFNSFNHANWGNPNTTVSSGGFGQISSFSSPRIMQVATKVVF